MRNSPIYSLILGAFIVFALGACSDDMSNKANQNVAATSTSNPEDGVKLRDVAGQATLPATATNEVKVVKVLDRRYAGRYHTQMSCYDLFAKCKDGNAEFIINLLPDGSAYRTFVYFGRVSNDISGAEAPVVSDYNHQDTWEYNAETNEIIVHRAEGVNFYYYVKDDQTIQMKREKILRGSPENIAFFAAGHVAPERSYTLTKYDD